MGEERVVADSTLSNEIRAHLGTTEGGKEIYLIRKPNCSVRQIAFGTGGELPEMLTGGYSSVSAAQGIVDSYLAKCKFEKEKKPAGTKRTGRGK